ncbi:MAG TPA: sigma-54 dependent transcriptional regulator [Thermoanaerobaculia bacterium]|jgi:two-component system response regulator PilR (NtrC family)|nr:sigma-54 dependent transcriptional regulator [Thermoanaerobaculia bacterium]
MNILIVDDEEVLQDILTVLIRKEGHTPLVAGTGEAALTILDREEVDLVLLDLMLPGMHGMEVLREIRRLDPDQVVVVITAFSSIESAIEAMREGAFHYIPKPFKNEEVLLTVRKGLEARRLTAENRSLREQLRQRFAFDNIIGKSKPMQQVYELIQLAAPSKSNILVLGESGTGKELVAKAIHHHSRRAEGPFITVNSGSMPADLLESNLFGHVRGAFTGAVASKKGLFELANNGSIFFDEIGNIPLDTQSKLLRVIQEREFMRLGGLETIRVDVRIIAATNADLEAAVQQGAFREDLFYRLNVITVTLPPLRKRTEDVPLLAQHFLSYYARENEKAIRGISPRAMELLLDYPWPGNVRELENAIERAVVLSTGEVLTEELLPASVRQRNDSHSGAGLPPPVLPPNGISFKDAVSEYERQIIIRALQSCGGVQKRAAELLQVKPTTLHEMMKRLNISTESLVST